jgi:hypothetical protein
VWRLCPPVRRHCYERQRIRSGKLALWPREGVLLGRESLLPMLMVDSFVFFWRKADPTALSHIPQPSLERSLTKHISPLSRQSPTIAHHRAQLPLPLMASYCKRSVLTTAKFLKTARGIKESHTIQTPPQSLFLQAQPTLDNNLPIWRKRAYGSSAQYLLGLLDELHRSMAKKKQ